MYGLRVSVVWGAMLMLVLLGGPAQASALQDPAVFDPPARGEPKFSVLELPPVAGSEQAELAVKWAGEQPAWLQPGYVDGQGQFQPQGSAYALAESMSLLPLPKPPPGERVWRLQDSGGQVLAEQRQGTGDQWQPGFFTSGFSRDVRAAVVFQDELIVAGRFSSVDGQVVNLVARWNGSDWLPLSGPSGTGVLGEVNALTVYNDELIVGGFFFTAGGVTVNHIARWTGSDWLPLGGPSGVGVNSFVNALTVYNGELIVGGSFSSAGGETVNRVARWTGTDWLTLSGPSGIGVSGSQVNGLIVYDGELIVAGTFGAAGAEKVNNIARWTGSDWLPLSSLSGTGVDGNVQALTVYDGELVVGGAFSNAGGETVNRIARWTGSDWLPLSGPSGTGMNDSVLSLASFQQQLFAGGQFDLAGGLASTNIAVYEKTQDTIFADGFEGAGSSPP